MVVSELQVDYSPRLVTVSKELKFMSDVFLSMKCNLYNF